MQETMIVRRTSVPAGRLTAGLSQRGDVGGGSSRLYPPALGQSKHSLQQRIAPGASCSARAGLKQRRLTSSGLCWLERLRQASRWTIICNAASCATGAAAAAAATAAAAAANSYLVLAMPLSSLTIGPRSS